MEVANTAKRKIEEIFREWDSTTLKIKKARLIEAVAPITESFELQELEGLDTDVQLAVLKEMCEDYRKKIDSMQKGLTDQGKEIIGLKYKISEQVQDISGLNQDISGLKQAINLLMNERNWQRARMLAGDVVYRLQSWAHVDSAEGLAQAFQFTDSNQKASYVETAVSLKNESIGPGHLGKEAPDMTWDDLISFIHHHYPIANKKRDALNFIALSRRLSNLRRPFESWN